MKSKTSAAILFAWLLIVDVVVFLVEKVASTHAAQSPHTFLISLALQPWLWASLALKLIQLWLWTRILSVMDISKAFPLSSLGYPLAMFAAVAFLHERLQWQTWFGAILITVGAALLGESNEPAGETLKSD